MAKSSQVITSRVKDATASRLVPAGAARVDHLIAILGGSGGEASRLLTEVSSGSPAAAQAERQRYIDALKAFGRAFGFSREVVVVRAPGRVNTIGEHTDYNNLPVAPGAIDRSIVLVAASQPGCYLDLRNVNPRYPDRRIDLAAAVRQRRRSSLSWEEWSRKSDIRPFPQGDHANYVLGAALRLAEEFPKRRLRGMQVMVSGDIPEAAGLSSSSALVVASGLTVAALNQLRVAPLRLCELLGQAEWFVGTHGGFMDQTTIYLAERGCILFIEFDPLRVKAVPFFPDAKLMLVNSLVRVDKGDGSLKVYNRRPGECRAGLALINAMVRAAEPPFENGPRNELGSLRDLNPGFLGLAITGWAGFIARLHGALPQKIRLPELSRRAGLSRDGAEARFGPEPPGGYAIRARVRHVVEEAVRTRKAISVLRAASGLLSVRQREKAKRAYGELMRQAHASARDLFEISCPELEAIYAIVNTIPGVYGARLTGAGFGGSMVVLLDPAAEGRVREELRRNYFQRALASDTHVMPRRGSDECMHVVTLAPGAGCLDFVGRDRRYVIEAVRSPRAWPHRQARVKSALGRMLGVSRLARYKPRLSVAKIILAAGAGTRLGGAGKATFHLGGKTLLERALALASCVPGETIVVVRPEQEEVVRRLLARTQGRLSIGIQREALGTADAVLSAKSEVSRDADAIMVMYVDMINAKKETLLLCLAVMEAMGGSFARLVFPVTPRARAYAPVVVDACGFPVGIRETHGGRGAQRFGLDNTGIFFFHRSLLAELEDSRAELTTGEFELPNSLVVCARRVGGVALAIPCAATFEAVGLNSYQDLQGYLRLRGARTDFAEALKNGRLAALTRDVTRLPLLSCDMLGLLYRLWSGTPASPGAGRSMALALKVKSFVRSAAHRGVLTSRHIAYLEKIARGLS